MPDTCSVCSMSISRQKPGLFCSGSCKSAYHAPCVDIPMELVKFVDIPGFAWYCNDCKNSKNTIKDEVTTKLEIIMNDIK